MDTVIKVIKCVKLIYKVLSPLPYNMHSTVSFSYENLFSRMNLMKLFLML